MTPIRPALDALAARIADLSAEMGQRVTVDVDEAADRSDVIALATPTRISANRSCRLIEAADGWIALNLARDEDRDLIPAWLDGAVGDADWTSIAAAARGRPWRELIESARLFGLPASGVGERRESDLDPPLVRYGTPSLLADRPLKVVDLSSLWAGPLCGRLLAQFGADVIKVESRARPDPSRFATPRFFARFNATKRDLSIDFSDRARLRALILGADIIISSARPRAFDQLGLDLAGLFAEKPDLIWVAISGYGWIGGDSDRVAFGDDAAAAGGLVRWTARRTPHFLGDALADPLTGLAAAAGALRAVAAGGGVLVDAAMAGAAAGAANMLGLIGACRSPC